MATARQETEIRPGIEEQAIREVEGYIEQLEKKTEIGGGDSNQNKPQIDPTAIQSNVSNDMGKAVMQAASAIGKKKIVLPLNQEEVKQGLHRQMLEGARWLAEWCVFMIKKYPGRVFYPVT